MPATDQNAWIELQTFLEKDPLWTIKALADVTGLSISYLYDLRRGYRRPTPAAIAKIAEALNVPKSMLEPRAKAAA